LITDIGCPWQAKLQACQKASMAAHVKIQPQD